MAKPFMRMLAPGLLALSLAACENTVAGLGRDMQKMGASMSGDAQPTRLPSSYGDPAPPAYAVPPPNDVPYPPQDDGSPPYLHPQ